MRAPLLAAGLAGLLSSSVCTAVAAEGDVPPPPTNALTRAAQVRALAVSETARQLPVRLTGVVIDTATVAPDRFAIILEDATAGIYVLTPPNARTILSGFQRGDWLQITGVTGSGQFAPIVIASAAEKLGATNVPAAQPVTYQQLITGAMDAQWVEIKGVVHRVFEPASGSDVSRLVIDANGGLLPVRCVVPPDGPIQVDSEVRVRAVCYYQFNQKRQVLSPVLQVPRDVPVLVEKPAPADPYAAPLRSAATLLRFSPDNLYAYAHRVHLRGVVTFAQAGSCVWIRDGNSGLRIQTQQPGDLQPGDIIEVLGFPRFGAYPLGLENAVFREAGSTRPPVPLSLTNFDQAYDHEDDLVVLDGTLTQIQSMLDGVAFTLDKDGRLFKAVLTLPLARQTHADWETGSGVRVTGICSLLHDETRPFAGVWSPQSFQILLRSPADLTVVQAPPWWTLNHVAVLLGVITGVLALLTGLVLTLSRRRLREQERQRQMAEAEFAAILSERNRLAREIHDTLAQGLTATSVQLRLAQKHVNGASETFARHLDTALSLVQDSLREARNSIWNMRAHVLENGDLPGALRGILQQMADGTEIAGRLDVTGRVRRLPPVVENNVLRAGQEAIANAIKHSGAKQVNVTLEFEEKQFRLRVTDDGRGFDPQQPPSGDGGFGLVGMRERVAELKGELNIRSAAGQGAEILVTIPLSGE